MDLPNNLLIRSSFKCLCRFVNCAVFLCLSESPAFENEFKMHLENSYKARTHITEVFKFCPDYVYILGPSFCI